MARLRQILRVLVCMGLLASFMGCATSSPQSKTPGQYVDDSLITTKVKAAIVREPTLKVLQINVQTYKGRVQLSGFVDSRESASRAGEVAGSIEGVSSVENNLIVK